MTAFNAIFLTRQKSTLPPWLRGLPMDAGVRKARAIEQGYRGMAGRVCKMILILQPPL